MEKILLYASDGSALMKQGGATYEEAVKRGNVWQVANQSGVTSQAGLSLTTPVLTLYNPAGSGKRGVLWYASSVYTVIFAAAAAVWVARGGGPSAAAVTGTLSTAVRNAKTGAASGNVIQALLAATLPAAPIGVALLGAGLTGAVNLLPNTKPLERWFNGGILLSPGENLSVQTGAASGASGQFNEFIWEEVPE